MDRKPDFYIEKAIELTQKPSPNDEATRLNELFRLEWGYRLADNPLLATYEGFKGLNHLWPDMTPEAIAKRKKTWGVWTQALKSIARDKLTVPEQLSYDLFKYYLDDRTEGTQFPDELVPLTQMYGPHQILAETMSVMPASAPSDLEDILARLESIPTYLNQNVELLRRGLDAGVTPPGLILRDVPQQIRNQIVDDAAQAPVLVVLKHIPTTVESAVKDRCVREAVSLYRDKLVPAYQAFLKFVAETYLPGCRNTIACRDLPNGENWYRYLVKNFTTTSLTPDEIHDIGYDEVKRIRNEMEAVIKASGFKGDFDAFTEFLRTDPQFYFDRAEDLVKEYRNISKRADPELAKLFGRLPMLPYGVTPIPDYAAMSQTTAYYQPGSPEAGRPGYYYVNTYNLKSRPKWEMEPLTLHEAVPGHHLQIALSQELTGLPEFRKRGWITAYGEGWALYSERLGEQMGFYTSPYSKFGQLSYQMWRATRLVVDTGMHFKGWGREKAINFMMINTGKSKHDITVEVDRYIAWPAQALAYKIGELKIEQLRRMAEDTLGERFDIRAFHDEILCHGSMPLQTLETHIKRWLAERTAIT